MFNIGDEIIVIKYGQLSWTKTEIKALKLYSRTDTMFCYDLMPELVGKKGIIVNKAKCKCGSWDYAIKFKHDKITRQWFKQNQLKKA